MKVIRREFGIVKFSRSNFLTLAGSFLINILADSKIRCELTQPMAHYFLELCTYNHMEPSSYDVHSVQVYPKEDEVREVA